MKQEYPYARSSIWRIRYELAWAKLLAWVASRSGQAALKPEIHLEFAYLYAGLCRYHQKRGALGKGDGFMMKFAHHYSRARGSGCNPPGFDPPPVAVAAAMPIPLRRSVLVNAVSRGSHSAPDDAA